MRQIDKLNRHYTDIKPTVYRHASNMAPYIYEKTVTRSYGLLSYPHAICGHEHVAYMLLPIPNESREISRAWCIARDQAIWAQHALIPTQSSHCPFSCSHLGRIFTQPKSDMYDLQKRSSIVNNWLHELKRREWGGALPDPRVTTLNWGNSHTHILGDYIDRISTKRRLGPMLLHSSSAW